MKLTAARHRAVLALLLLHPNRVIAMNDIVDAVWPHSPPATARHQVLTVISALRRRLGDVGRPAQEQALQTRSPGYLLRIEPAQLDLHRFEARVQDADAATQAGDAQTAAGLLREAIGMWRGPALADIDAPFAATAARSLAERKRGVGEKLVDMELSLGRHADALSRLAGMIDEHPLHERFRAQLMLARYRSGDVVGALDAFRTARQVL
ncbi:AfsR/SARP family transcriptional regulator, partial [Allorhizocola rhizosphaerae]|uniref:AfsR/SARP family transcriptional regulator n=1 Tax=Allorhizocola rhizosphaerae TaxID=1872709 RepID=UPI0013C2D673